MPIAAQSIIRRTVETLQDPTSIRWPVNELVRYLNDGQREITLHRPDSMVTSATAPLVAGAKQTLPAGGTKLIEVVRNTGGSKRSIRLTNREILDAQVSGWYGLPGVTEILHFMYDVRDPRTYYVYPVAAATGASVELVYAAMPVDIAEPADSSLYGAVAGNISVPDIYGNVLQDYILYRAYSKDSEYAGNAARSQAHYQLFTNALGMEMRGTVGVAPTSMGNPNSPVASLLAP